jgi:uncharacterized protein (TIGR03437 family)
MLKALTLLAAYSAALFAQAPTVTAVVNAASFGTQICPGLVATVYGANFGSNAATVSVSVGGKPGYVYTQGFLATQMDVQIPFEVSAGPTTLTVTVAGVPTAAFPITVSAASPFFTTISGSGSGLAAVYDTSAANAAVTLTAPAHVGDNLIATAVGLGPTSPATPTTATGLAPATASTVTLPTVTVGGIAAVVAFAGVVQNTFSAFYQVNFKVPAGVQGTVPLVISVGAASSSSVVDVALVGLSAVIVNGSFANAGTIAPGSIGSVFANGLGSASTNQVSGLFPSTQSEGVQVTFNGTAAPMFHLLPQVSPQQIDLFVPSNLPTSGTVNVQLTTSSSNYPNYTLNMVPASPSMFRFTDPKTSNAFAVVQFAGSAWVVLPATATADIGFPSCTASTSAATECGQPANIGDTLVIYLTGLGLATPNGSPTGTPLPTGQNPPASGNPLYETPTMPMVTIGGIQATVLFSGLTPGYAGEYQIDVTVPAGVASGDSVPVQVTMLGLSDTANISIQPSRIAPPQ